jgi:hypothetical protein
MAKGDKTKVYTVFARLPVDIRERILKVLKKECREIEFVGNADLRYFGKDWVDYFIQRDPDFYIDDSESNAVLQEIEEKKDDLAGIILFFGGHIDKRFLLTGLPTIIVDVNPFPSLQIGFKWAVAEAKMNRTNFLVSSYSDFDLSESVASARIRDLAEKVGLFSVLNKMKGTKILDVQVKGFGAEPHEHWWRLNQELFLKRLKENLGMDVEIMDYRDFFKEYDKIPGKEARAVAKRWIDEQRPNKAIKNKRNIGGITEKDVIDGARVYLTADRFVKKFKANAITVDSMTWSTPQLSKGKPCPSMSPGIAEFQLHGIPAVCESDMEGIVTAAMGHYLTGGYGLMGDFIVDPFNDAITVCHCSAPINPYGDNYRAPYSIGREKFRWPQFYVDLPDKGDVTIMRVNILKRQISLLTGEVISGETVWKSFRDYSCCSKVAVKTNAKQIYQKYDYRTFTTHQILFYGDHRQKVKDLAALIGFEVIEEDRP